MKSLRFIQNLKCECFLPHNYCNCAYRKVAGETLLQNLKYLSQKLIEVMKMCKIWTRHAEAADKIIRYHFLHFNEERSRINSTPRKRIFKESLFFELARKCNMNRIESQMAFTIIKWAFKAFYYGTDEGGVPNPLLENQLKHRPECFWLQAAKQTAQMCAWLEGLLPVQQKYLEYKIMIQYKDIVDFLAKQPKPNRNQECVCSKCYKRIMTETLHTTRNVQDIHQINDPYEYLYRQETADLLKAKDEKEKPHLSNEMPNDSQSLCSSSSLFSDDEVKEQFDTSTQYSTKVTAAIKCTCASLAQCTKSFPYIDQIKALESNINPGPFICRWFPINKSEYNEDDKIPEISIPKGDEEYICEKDVKSEDDELTCISECSCPSNFESFQEFSDTVSLKSENFSEDTMVGNFNVE